MTTLARISPWRLGLAASVLTSAVLVGYFEFVSTPAVSLAITAHSDTSPAARGNTGVSAGSPISSVNAFSLRPVSRGVAQLSASSPPPPPWPSGPGDIAEFCLPTANASPESIVSGPDGNIWFTEFYGNKIGRITLTGQIQEFPLQTSGAQPLGLTVGPDGNLWFTEYNEYQIGRITPAGKIDQFSFQPPPHENDIMNYKGPVSIITGPDGNLWFTGSNIIGKATTAGMITVYEVADPSSHPPAPKFAQAWGITLDRSNNLWFTDPYTGTDHGAIWKINTPSSPTFQRFAVDYPPYGITVGPDGNLWFAEHKDGRIGSRTPAGALSSYHTSGTPLFVGLGSDGNVWFGEQINNVIGQIKPTTSGNSVVEYSLPTSDINPLGITTGPDGNLWVTDFTGDKILRIFWQPGAPSISLSTIAGGGNGGSSASAGGLYRLGGTIGQGTAGMSTGGPYSLLSLRAGFWATEQTCAPPSGVSGEVDPGNPATVAVPGMPSTGHAQPNILLLIALAVLAVLTGGLLIADWSRVRRANRKS